MTSVTLAQNVRTFLAHGQGGRCLYRPRVQVLALAGSELELHGPVEITYDHRDQEAFWFIDPEDGEKRFVLAAEMDPKIESTVH